MSQNHNLTTEENNILGNEKNKNLTNIDQFKDKLLFIPLGGTNEIGINLNLYQYKGKWIMVDCGIGFADENTPGANIILPDISFIKQYKEQLTALIITHAHEDHIGAIPYLISELRCPIYCTNFTSSFLKAKLKNFELDYIPEIHTIEPSSQIKLEPFTIDLVPLAHSAPEMQALYIKTDKGNILHTGDWKFDSDPIIGQQSDEKLLRKIGQEGVLALVCDSTNVFNPNNSGSEGELKKNLQKIISSCKGKVLVTTFASNLARLDGLINTAYELGRKVVLSGQSILRVVDAAKENGYLKNTSHIIEDSEISNYKDNEILIIATGCQGETMATTSRVANGTHQNIKLNSDDIIIFSSKIIPGNEKKIFSLFNKLIKRKINIITERDQFVHVSGHPGIEDIKKMFEYTKPQVCIPVHGEPIHINAHAKLALECNIPQAIELENGSVLELDSKNSKILGKVHSGYLVVDGDIVVPINSRVFFLRNKMNNSGIAHITIVQNDSKHKILIDTPGVTEKIEEQFIFSLNKNIRNILTHHKKSGNNKSNYKLIDTIKSLVRKEIKKSYNKYPIVTVNIINF